MSAPDRQSVDKRFGPCDHLGMNHRDLADFLRHRREALRPDEAGIPFGTGHRRTPGLRREEVAWLAGISANYYERLEQARAARPSPQVLTSLGRALGLSETELTHLARLAGQAPTALVGPDKEVPGSVLRLLERLENVPAYVLDARYDVVAWNAMAAALITDFSLLPSGQRNVLRMSMTYGDTLCGTRVGDEQEPVRQAAADLREAAARYPSDPELHRLIEDLAAHDPVFAATWARHDVRARPTLRKRINHADLGVLDLDCQTLHVPGHDQRVVLYTAEAGSPSQDKLSQIELGVFDRV